MLFLVDKILQKAVEAHMSGELSQPESLYRAILKKQPIHPDTNYNLGVLAASLNKFELVLLLFRAALKVNPNQGKFWLGDIDAVIRSNRFNIVKDLMI